MVAGGPPEPTGVAGAGSMPPRRVLALPVPRAIVWNPGAGRAEAGGAEHLARQLGDDEAAAPVLACDDDRDPAACARAAIAAGADVVVAAGGDGTVAAVAGALCGSAARLAIAPIGTANSFAAALGIPADLDEALACVVAGHTRVVDMARVACGDDHRTMIMHGMIGVHADAIAGASADAKRRWGTLAYVASAARQLDDLASFQVELSLDEHVIRCRAIDVAVANLAPARTALAQGPARLVGDDGRLDVTIVAADSLGEALAAGLHLYRTARQGARATRDDVGYASGSRIVIVATPPQRVLIDGEAVGVTPVTFEVLPGALRVIAPPAPAAPDGPRGVKLAGLPDLEVER
jgi:YegS/Rv2252/BmrU family lipid kinase